MHPVRLTHLDAGLAVDEDSNKDHQEQERVDHVSEPVVGEARQHLGLVGAQDAPAEGRRGVGVDVVVVTHHGAEGVHQADAKYHGAEQDSRLVHHVIWWRGWRL